MMCWEIDIDHATNAHPHPCTRTKQSLVNTKSLCGSDEAIPMSTEAAIYISIGLFIHLAPKEKSSLAALSLVTVTAHQLTQHT